MQDRYLCKARPIGTRKQWVTGFCAVLGEKTVIIVNEPEKFYDVDSGKNSHGNKIVEVIPKTVCWCTGLKDKNGTIIWENDIVKHYNDDKNSVTRGRSSNSPCMIVFCSFEQMPTLIDAAYKHGFVHYIPLVFVKNYSPQVLKANMRVVGATEYALVFYREKLPKFRNGARVDEDGKTIRGTGKMIFNWFSWEKDGKDIPKIHPTQKPVALYEWLLNRYAKPGDIILDTHVGSASSLIACYRTNHPYVGFELDKHYYDLSKKRLDAEMAQMRLSDFMPEVMP